MMDDGWVVIRASDTGQKPSDAPDSILFEFHSRERMVRIKRGKVVYIVPLRLYEDGGDALIDAAEAARRKHD